MFTLVTFLSLFLSVGVAPAKKSPKLVSADGSFYMHLYKLDDVRICHILLSCNALAVEGMGGIPWEQGRFYLLVTWASCNGPLMTYQNIEGSRFPLLELQGKNSNQVFCL